MLYMVVYWSVIRVEYVACIREVNGLLYKETSRVWDDEVLKECRDCASRIRSVYLAIVKVNQD